VRNPATACLPVLAGLIAQPEPDIAGTPTTVGVELLVPLDEPLCLETRQSALDAALAELRSPIQADAFSGGDPVSNLVNSYLIALLLEA
jgi:hypothetical protein